MRPVRCCFRKAVASEGIDIDGGGGGAEAAYGRGIRPTDVVSVEIRGGGISRRRRLSHGQVMARVGSGRTRRVSVIVLRDGVFVLVAVVDVVVAAVVVVVVVVDDVVVVVDDAVVVVAIVVVIVS